METQIEIGAENDRAAIRAELKILEDVATELEIPIYRVIVPMDFDASVDSVQGTSGYASQREHVAVAKVIKCDEGIVIVLSPYLFTERFDSLVRIEIYIHELVHAGNKGKYPSLEGLSPTRQRLLHNIVALYDDYCANRTALVSMEAAFPEKSSLYCAHRDASIEHHFEFLADSSGKHQAIKNAVAAFRVHGDVGRYCSEVHELLDAIGKSLVFLYSYIDSLAMCSELEERIAASPFCDQRAQSLVRAFRQMYERKEFNFMPHLGLMQDYLEVFGMRFEDRVNGQYLHVLDV